MPTSILRGRRASEWAMMSSAKSSSRGKNSIAGIDLPKEKRVEIGLTYIYGIGRKSANDILAHTGINPDTRVKDLTPDQEGLIREYLDKNNIIVEGDLRRNVALDIKRLVEIQQGTGTSYPCCFEQHIRLRWSQCLLHREEV